MDILIADDEAHIREALKEFLQQQGHRVFLAEDGAVAVQKASIQRFDLLICDISMAKLDGVDAIERIQHTRMNKDTPAIVISAHLDIANVRRLKGRVLKALVKPFELEELLAALPETT